MLRLTTLATVLVGLAGTTLAHDEKAGELAIDHPWARATAASQGNGASYMSITNNGAADRIIAAETPAADRAEMHTHGMDDAGVMRMRQVEAIDLPAGETVELAPGGLHIMMFDLAEPLVEGATFPLTITFEQAGRVELEVQVEPVTYGIGGSMDHGKTH